VARVPDVRRAGRRLREPADRDDAATVGEPLEEAPARMDLSTCRPAVSALGARMGRDDVPAQDIVLELQLAQHRAHDRRGRLGRPGAGQLPLGRERQAADAGATVTRCLADEQEDSLGVRFEVRLQPTPQQVRTRPVAVEVERRADVGGSQFLDEPHGSHSD
jgi:hypothetical protein